MPLHLESLIPLTIPEIFTKFEHYPRITNCVATVSLGVNFDLNSLVPEIPSASREPDQFAALTIRFDKTTCLLFAAGTMVITGAKTENGSKLAAHIYRLVLEKIEQPIYNKKEKKYFFTTLEHKTQFSKFNIVNIVGDNKLDFGGPNGVLKLDVMDENGISNVSWDPETFPGLRFTINRSKECPINRPKLMAYIFSGRKIVIMGARVKDDIYISNNYLKGFIENHISSKPLDLVKLLSTSSALSDITSSKMKRKKARTIQEPNEDPLLEDENLLNDHCEILKKTAASMVQEEEDESFLMQHQIDFISELVMI
jgi:TATA-box binding protein (TBP) (component of TFIID and TFIIIB)